MWSIGFCGHQRQWGILVGTRTFQSIDTDILIVFSYVSIIKLPRTLFKPRFIHSCHQNPNPFHGTVQLEGQACKIEWAVRGIVHRIWFLRVEIYVLKIILTVFCKDLQLLSIETDMDKGSLIRKVFKKGRGVEIFRKFHPASRPVRTL